MTFFTTILFHFFGFGFRVGVDKELLVPLTVPPLKLLHRVDRQHFIWNPGSAGAGLGVVVAEYVGKLLTIQASFHVEVVTSDSTTQALEPPNSALVGVYPSGSMGIGMEKALAVLALEGGAG